MKKLFLRRVALTNQHGSWVFLLSPLAIGLAAANDWHRGVIFLTAAALSGFLLHHPLTLALKMAGGRKSRRNLPAVVFWVAVYGLLLLVSLGGLILTGRSYLLILSVPAGAVFLWYLYLVYRHEERRQLGLELVGSGVLALAAPAGYWVGVGSVDPTGWWLWGLTWLQSAASIVYAYLRLEQRELEQAPSLRKQIQMGVRAFMYVSFNLAAVGLLSAFGLVPEWLFVPYLVQWLETSWGITHPAVGWKPSRIGWRQLTVSTLFTVLFILAWRLSG
jgi:hypothetical protein